MQHVWVKSTIHGESANCLAVTKALMQSRTGVSKLRISVSGTQCLCVFRLIRMKELDDRLGGVNLSDAEFREGYRTDRHATYPHIHECMRNTELHLHCKKVDLQRFQQSDPLAWLQEANAVKVRNLFKYTEGVSCKEWGFCIDFITLRLPLLLAHWIKIENHEKRGEILKRCTHQVFSSNHGAPGPDCRLEWLSVQFKKFSLLILIQM